MAAVIKNRVKSWMIVYIGFVVTLGATVLGDSDGRDLTSLSPGSLPGEIATDQDYFRPAAGHAAVGHVRRTDI